MNTTPPKVGQLYTVRGVICRIVKVHAAGTMDVSSLDGKHHWRVTGLPFR